MPQLCKQERKRPRLVRKRLSRTNGRWKAGRGWRRALDLKIFTKKGCSLSVEWEKRSFTTFSPLRQILGKMPYSPQLEKILLTPTGGLMLLLEEPFREGVPMSMMKIPSLVSVRRPLRTPSVVCPELRTHVVFVRCTDELLCGGYKWVSRFDTLRFPTRWPVVQAPWHGVLGTVWLLCDEAQQVGCLRG